MAETMTITAQEQDSSRYAGFWVRFLSVCIDLVLSTPFYLAAGYLSKKEWVGDTIYTVAFMAAYALFFSSRLQGTPGMYLLKFRITDVAGSRISFRRALYWVVTSMVIWLICFAGIVYLQSRFDLFGIAQLEMSCFQENIGWDDCAHEIESAANISFADFQMLVNASLALCVFLLLIWALSIALPKDKTGFHNLLCGTRFLKGRSG